MLVINQGANAFKECLNYLGALVDYQHGDQSAYGEAYATTSDSESSAEKSTKSSYRPIERMWGGEFRDAMRSIRREFTYNKVHDASSCFDIIKFLAAADAARDIRKAKSPSGMANAVEEGLNYLGALVDSQHGDQSTYDEAYTTTSDSKLSTEKSTKSPV